MGLPIFGNASEADWLLIAASTIVLAIASRRYLRRRRRRHAPPPPALVFPYLPPFPVGRNGTGNGETTPATNGSRTAASRGTFGGPRPPVNGAAAGGNGTGSAAGRARTARVPDGEGAHDPIESTAETATLQLLPGRLDVLTGPDRGAEIRFVKQDSPGETEYTLGRAPAVDFRHISVGGETVSRLHAAMRFSGERWILVNLSRTNPTRVEDCDLVEEGASRILVDGDRVELGEVVLRFSGHPARPRD